MTAEESQRRYVKQQLSRIFNKTIDLEKRQKMEDHWNKAEFSGKIGGRNRKSIQTTEEL